MISDYEIMKAIAFGMVYDPRMMSPERKLQASIDGVTCMDCDVQLKGVSTSGKKKIRTHAVCPKCGAKYLYKEYDGMGELARE